MISRTSLPNPDITWSKYISFVKTSNAINTNTATCMRTDAIGPRSPNKHTWWKVDLGGVYNIYSTNVLFKDYDSFGMYGIA